MLALSSPLYADSYSSTDTPIAISASGRSTINSYITVPATSGTISDVNVRLNILHTYDQDLTITLIHPDGTRIELSSRNGGSNDNYTNTVFDQQAGTSIISGSAPFTGTYRPEGNLDILNNKSSSGSWTLEITDSYSIDGGSLESWSLDISIIQTDYDNDGLPTNWETTHGLDPYDDGSTNPRNGPDGDPDGDGLPNSEEYQQGFNPQSNDFGRAYVARPSKVTIMIVNAHPDDEGIFFGGTIPYYTQTLAVPTICISMTSGDFSLAPTVREEEFRNAAWEYGLRNHPLFPRFRDYWIEGEDINGTWDIWNDNILGNGDEAAGKLKATEYLATQIRKYRPEVVVSHDVNGEYGHSNHKATGVASADAFAMAADPNKDLDGLPAWQAKKLYLHRYNTEPGTISKLFHDHWETASISGLSPRQVANNGLAYHATQGPQTVSTAYLTGETASTAFDPHPSEEWGLHTTHVGPDTTTADFTINGTLYSGFAKNDFLENISIDRDSDLLPDAWENLHSGSNIAMSPDSDPDGDGLSNLDEFRLGLDPTTPSKAPHINFSADGTSLNFTLAAATGTGYTGVTRTYTLQSSTDMQNWLPEVQGVADGNIINFSIPNGTSLKFYRCSVTVK